MAFLLRLASGQPKGTRPAPRGRGPGFFGGYPLAGGAKKAGPAPAQRVCPGAPDRGRPPGPTPDAGGTPRTTELQAPSPDARNRQGDGQGGVRDAGGPVWNPATRTIVVEWTPGRSKCSAWRRSE